MGAGDEVLSCFIGVGLRTPHYPYLRNKPQTPIKWFEAISENFIDSEGPPLEMLLFMREKYPIALHGVSLSIGSPDGLDIDYLKKLKNLIQIINPIIVSDHCCFTRTKIHSSFDLLPIPFTKETLQRLIDNINYIQDFLGRTFVLENVSSYFEYKDSIYREWEFLSNLCEKTGCKLLFDINNLYVSAVNLKFNPHEYLHFINPNSIAQIHLAGYTDMGDFLFDTHSHSVYPPVWKLFEEIIPKIPNVPILLEWDDEIPEFPELEKEALKAVQIWNKTHADSRITL